MTYVAAAPVERVPSTGSTNEDLLARARAGEAGPLWRRADQQLTGRGRRGRTWASPVGNLHMSLLLTDPAAEPRFLPQLAHVAAVALAEAVATVTGRPDLCRLKWPNDLLHGGAKVAGILVEGTRGPDGRTACVTGWGVNCIHHPEGLAYRTTDLSAASGRQLDADVLAPALRATMSEALASWAGGRNYAAIRTAWLRHSVDLGTPVTVTTVGGRTEGTFAGLDAAGRFLLRMPAGITAIEAGEIDLTTNSNLKSETAATVG